MPTSVKPPSKGELDFINEMTRKLLVGWAHSQVQGGELDLKGVDPYVNHAIAKGWLSKREPRRVSSTGFKVAGAYLRR